MKIRLNPIFQQAISNCLPEDGTLVAVIPPPKDLEFVAPFLPKEPLGAKIVRKLPPGMRIIRKEDGKLQLAVACLEFGWGLDGSHKLLPEQFFIGDENSFGQKVNKVLGYAVVQHPDCINGILKYPDRVSFDPLLRPVIVMSSDGFVAHDYLLKSLLEYCLDGRSIVRQILDVAPPDIADRIAYLFAAVLPPR